MAGFEIDHKAFRAQNVGRPAEHLIREAIQNAFDENPDHVRVTITPAKGRGIEVTIEDDGPGFKDVKDIWTIFASGKRDDPTKRGRLGRGLKELISVSSTASIATSGKITTFVWNRHSLNRSSKKVETVGTRIAIAVPSWNKTTIPHITRYLSLFVPPEGTAMSVNGIVNKRPDLERTIHTSLATVVYDEGGIPREQYRMTDIRLLRTNDKWFYEMGIPVEPISEEDGFEYSIDVQQRTPLRPERDMLPRTFVRAIYAEVANAMMDVLPVEEMTDLWMEEAVGHYKFDSTTKGEIYIRRRFGENAARAVNGDAHDRNVRAQQDGVNVIQTSAVSASVRDLVRSVLPSTVDLYPIQAASAKYIPEVDWTAGQTEFVTFTKWLAKHLGLTDPNITMFEAPDANCEADSAVSGTIIRINRSCLGDAFFDIPKLSNWVPLIVHELAHRTGNGHDAVFWREVERMSGNATQLVHEHGEMPGYHPAPF